MLSLGAQKVLNEYFSLPFPGLHGVRCPYFNNSRLRQRGQLRVLVGKGTPREIVDETQIISLQYHAGLFDKSGNCCLHGGHDGEINLDEVRKFLVDHNLGVECSGFVTQILREHFKEVDGVDIARKFFKASINNPVRYLISKLRPVENISVKTYADDRNTKVIGDYRSITPGDVIIFLGIKIDNNRNHILLITENDGKKISYVHARAWSNEGKYGHGVAGGVINLTTPEKGLLEQDWVELGKSGQDNETWREAASAEKVEVRRVII